ncbi:GxxExxY protein [Candidatus Dependentiae bacterium]|nr:GxxExxY protein [Candidatus Dependentiae bacterium]
MKWDDTKYGVITEKIIEIFFIVHNKLGPGFSEKAYHLAVLKELRKKFNNVESEKQMPVYYDDEVLIYYIPDVVVEDSIIIEVKAVTELNDNHKAQIISQLRASKILVGLLVNFAENKVIFKRIDNFYEIIKQGL